MAVSWGDDPKTSAVIMCGGIPTKRDLEIVAEFRQFLRNRKGESMTTPRNEEGSDKGAPELNDLVPDLDPEEYRDPLYPDVSGGGVPPQ